MADPDSERRLLKLLQELGLVGRAGRPRGAPGAPWTVVTQSPHPEQPWALYEAFHEPGVARDEIAGLRPAEGELVLLLEGSRPTWLGVGDASGFVQPAPADPDGNVTREAGSVSWIETWEGRSARAQQMLGLCWAMAPRAPILATCACAAVAVEKRAPGQEATAALAAARRWAEGAEVPTSELSTASFEALALSRRLYGVPAVRSACYAALYACDAAALPPAAARGPGAARTRSSARVRRRAASGSSLPSCGST